MDDLKKPKYPSTSAKRKLIDKEFRQAANAINQVKEGSAEALDFFGAGLAKRKKAVLSLLERIDSNQYPGIFSIEEAIVSFESAPDNSYDELEIRGRMYLAAALWMLDEMKRNGKIHEASGFLPVDFEAAYDTNMPFEFYDPSYENEMIGSVVSVLEFKEGSDGNHWTARRGEDNRTDFWGLMDLLDRDRVETACRHFEEKQAEYIDRFLRCFELFDKAEEAIVKRAKGVTKNVLMVNYNPEEEQRRAAQEWEVFKKNRDNFNYGCVRYPARDRRSIINDCGFREVSSIMSEFVVDDPYELCFALVYLTEKGDESPWLFRTGYAVMHTACSMLPWFDKTEDDFDNPLTYFRNDWTQQEQIDRVDLYHKRYKNGLNLAQMVFNMTAAVFPRNLHPFEQDRAEMLDAGVDEHTVDTVLAASEMLFFPQFQTKAQNLRDVMDWLGNRDDSEESTTDQPEAPLGGYWGQFGSVGKPVTEKKPDIEEETVKDPAKLKAEIKQLKNLLAEMRREIKTEKKKAEKEQAEAMREHRELADLREVVFNQENMQESMEEEPPIGNEWPYKVKKDTLVFGGHANWLKGIKSLLVGNIRFIDKDLVFDTNIVKNADQIWIQPNVMSHKQYYRIVDTARQYGKPIRYFTQASWAKGAEQVKEQDE